MNRDQASFYSKLHFHHGSLSQLLLDEDAFSEVPDSWNILVTDVQNSTQAIQEGKQQLVNLAATGSIIACLNISRSQGVEIPFFFGGDGATILVPNPILNECLFALQLHQERCGISFDFHLRVGHRKVKDMKDLGSHLKIAKYKRNDLHVMPIILGDALQEAERSIKAAEVADVIDPLPYNLDLTGMECKWNKVRPPQSENEVLTLIVKATHVSEQRQIYSKVLEKMESIYGEDRLRHPVTVKRLKMVHKWSRLKDEVQMKFRKADVFKVLSSWTRTVFGSLFVSYTVKGQGYLNNLIQLTETLLIDGAINTVISGNVKQRRELLGYLEKLEREQELLFGFYVSNSSVLSCFVTALDDYHIHFLDGDNGGYTQASKIMKAKLK